jgi:exodeoxyribonuclease V beta subunit
MEMKPMAELLTPNLDPLTLPLRGTRLIEASAGTGKTYTIAALYVRLVLGHGAPQLGPLVPSQILVMTFTKAATRELSYRIRARLVEAAACFRGAQPPENYDAFLRGLLDAYPDADEREQAAWRLASAAESMDEAAVFTIDAWCQRMLREHAFDSGSLFDEELQPNESALLLEAAADYWRQQVYPLELPAADLVLASFKDVATLAQNCRSLLGEAWPATQLATPLLVQLESFLEERRQLLEGWPERAERLRAWVLGLKALKDFPFDRKLGKQYLEGWLNQLDAWIAAGALAPPHKDLNFYRFGATYLEEVRKENVAAVPLPPECAELDSLLAAVKAVTPADVQVRSHAAASLSARMQWLKQQQRRFGFADLLDRLELALGVPGTPLGKALRDRIRAQYPVALVDEFQDTSPRQLAIFDKVYRLQDDREDRALLLIGDPKQSIYAFRGADIYSYLEARHATVGRHYALPMNFRSTVSMVEAVNALFGEAEVREPEGAFRLAGEQGANLPFAAVSAFGRKEALVFKQGGAWQPVVPFTFCLDDFSESMRDSRRRYARLGALRIAAWLRGEAAGFVPAPPVASSSEPPRRLRPADIVVLVRTGVEAAVMRRELRRLGIQSAYLSEGDSVFSTPEAADLLRLLQAIASPGDTRLARAALASGLVGRSLAELQRLAVDEEAFDAACTSLRDLQQVWKSRGVLAMVREALHWFGVPGRWLAATDGMGERRLTNVLQLGELLQAASQQVEGEAAQVHWLSLQVANGEADTPMGGADDPQLLRLESDVELVRIVTIHKSKGLEYPVVVLPFATHHRVVAARNTKFVRKRVVEDGVVQRRLELAPDSDALKAADVERQQEDLRLLYVALTRARHAVWVGAPTLRTGNSPKCVWEFSALGYLLRAGNPEDPASCVTAVQAFAAKHPTVVVESPQVAEERSGLAWVRGEEEVAPVLAPALPYIADFERYWTLHSYSGLVRSAHGTAHVASPAAATAPTPPLPETDTRSRERRNDEPEGETRIVAPSADLPVPARHRFPAGAMHGDFLHKLLEWLAEEYFALAPGSAHATAVRRELEARCERTAWREYTADIVDWLTEVVTTPLSCSSTPVTLAGLASTVPEMEFWMPADGLVPTEIDQLCTQHILPGLERPALSGGALHGLLKGVMDLVFEHEGRYWVLDYKSNRLGADDAAYTPAAMEEAIAKHRYDVQAVLYLLALHRQLQARLGAAYRPQEQLGGAVYLFLRGSSGPAKGCATIAPPWEVLAALERRLPAVGSAS